MDRKKFVYNKAYSNLAFLVDLSYFVAAIFVIFYETCCGTSRTNYQKRQTEIVFLFATLYFANNNSPIYFIVLVL